MTRSRQTADWGSRAGLAKVIPSSVAVGSGTGSADSTGKVTFTTVSSVSLNGVFTTNYTKYFLQTNFQGSAGGGTNMRLRASGTDTSTGIYKRQYLAATGTSVTAARTTTDTSWINILYVPDNIEYNSSQLFIENPAQTTYTSAFSLFATSLNALLESNFQVYSIGATTSFDGFTLIPASGTITGNVTVYGYN